MSDLPIYQATQLNGYSTAQAITKSDDTIYDPPLNGLWIGGAGNVAVLLTGDTDPVTLTAAAAGRSIDGFKIKKVMSANTSATLIVGFRF